MHHPQATWDSSCVQVVKAMVVMEAVVVQEVPMDKEE